MFLHRAPPKVESSNSGDKDGKAGERKEDEFDFLSKHGGKVSIAAFGVAATLLYTYFKGNSNKSTMENSLGEASLVEPYELQELRFQNNIGLEAYQQIVSQALDGKPNTSYREFIALVQAKLGATTLGSGYLIDRLVYNELLKGREGEVSAGSRYDAAGPSASFVDPESDSVSTAYLLAVLSLAMPLGSGDARARGLFHLAHTVEAEGGGARVAYSDSVMGADHEEAPLEVDAEIDGQLTIGVEAVTEITACLIASDQIPCEKLVTGTGVKYPLRTYRKKTAAEVVAAWKGVVDKEKAKLSENTETLTRFTEADFLDFLLSKYVCAWGECYR